MTSRTLYQQGDIVVVRFPFTDLSQTKKRPALIVSNAQVNQTGDYLMVQITSQVKQDNLSLPILLTDYVSQPLPLVSHIRLHKMFLLNESLILYKFGSVTSAFGQAVTSGVVDLLR